MENRTLSSNQLIFMKNIYQLFFKAFFILLSFLASVSTYATTYTWIGTTSSAWNVGSNWDQGTVPGSTADVIIVTASNLPVLDGTRSVAGLTMTSGTLNLNTFTLTATGSVYFNGGTINNGTMSCTGSYTEFHGTTFGAAVTVTSADIYLNGSTFNSTVSLTKTGSINNFGNGGNTFYGPTTITNNGSGYLLTGNTTDIFNSTLKINKTSGTGDIYLAYSGTGHQFNDSLIFNLTVSSNIYIGNAGGTSTLASGKKIISGTSGFTAGMLFLDYMTLAGSTAQTINGTGNSLLIIENCTLNGSLTSTVGGVTLYNTVFNGAVSFTQTGSNPCQSYGSNVFNSTASFTVTGSGYFMMGNGSTGDVFNSNVTLTTSYGDLYTSYAAGATTNFHGNIIVNNTGPGDILIGGTGTSVLDSAKTIQVGSSGFNNGYLFIQHLTQNGNTAQNLTLTGSAILILGVGGTFNGPVNFTAPSIGLNGVTYNRSAIFTKTGSGTDIGDGNNIFNSTVIITNNGTGPIYSAYGHADIFNDTLKLYNSSTGTICLAHVATGTQFNGDIIFNNANASGIISMGQGAGTSTLASGKKIYAGTAGFNDGYLYLFHFTQLGSTSQNIAGIGNSLFLVYHSTFHGNLTSNTGSIYLFDDVFYGKASFTKNNSWSDPLEGGSLYYDSTSFINTGTGSINFNYHYGDTFYGPVTYTCSSTSSGQLYIAYNDTVQVRYLGNLHFNLKGTSGAGIYFYQGQSILASGNTVNIGSLGASTGSLHFKNFTQQGTTSQSLTLTGSAALYLESGTTFNGNADFSSPTLYMNGSTFNGNAVLTKTGGTDDYGTGGMTFNQDATINNTTTGNINQAYVNPDVFWGNVTLNNTSTGYINMARTGINKFYKDLTCYGRVYFGEGGGTISFEGGNAQTLYGNSTGPIPRVKINKTASQLTLAAPLNISISLDLVSKNIVTSSSYLVSLGDNATVSDASIASYVNGPMQKIGNDVFVFPIGKDTIYEPIKISAPSSTTDAFTAEAFNAAPPSFASNDGSMDGVSDCQYWNITRNVGTSSIAVTLMWDTLTCTDIDPETVEVARYYNTLWQSTGQYSLVDNVPGSVTSSDTLHQFPALFTFSEASCSRYAKGQELDIYSPINFISITKLDTTYLRWKINSVPTLSSSTYSHHTVVLQLASVKADPSTGLLEPDWSTLIEDSINYIPSVNDLTVGTYSKLLDDLLDLPDQDKYYFWRAGLKYKLPSGGVQPITWTDLGLFKLNGTAKNIPAAYLTSSHTNNINWVYEVTFMDENKTNQVISYIDGLGKTRQNQVLLSSQSKVMCTEMAYSEEGGGVVKSMVAPTGDSTFNYATRFFDVKNGSAYSDFGTEHFDREIVGSSYNTLMTSVPVDTLHGVGNYYRNNSTFESYVDDAKGYPYAYSVNYKDPLGKPMLIGGVGETFKITGGKEIQSFTTSPSYQELKRVYGKDKANTLSNITKSVTIDPNGVGSVTYTDNEGKVIATALSTCSTASANLDELNEDGKNGFTARYNVLGNDVLNSDGSRTSSSNFFLSCPSTSVNITYQIDQGVFAIGTSCKNCNYQVNMKMVEDATGLEVFNDTKYLPTDTSAMGCTSSPTTYTYTNTVSLSRAGTYTVYRTISSSKNTFGRSIVDQAIYDYTSTLMSDLTTRKNEFLNQYYGRDEYYLLRKMAATQTRPVQFRQCMSRYVGNYDSSITRDGDLSTARISSGFGIDIDSNNNIYFLDYPYYIRKISPSGQVTTLYNSSSLGIELFDLTVDNNGTVYFSNFDGGSKIYKLSSSGTVTQFNTGKSYVHAVEYLDGFIYFRHTSDFSWDSSNVSKIDVSGNLVKENYLHRGSELPFGFVSEDKSMVVRKINDNEEIFLADGINDKVYKISSNGTYIEIAGDGSHGCDNVTAIGSNSELGNPISLAIDPKGDLYINSGLTIKRMDLSTGLVYKFAGNCSLPGNTDAPIDSTATMSISDMAFDNTGNLFTIGQTAIRKISNCGINPTCPEVLPQAQLTFNANPPMKLVLQPNARDGKDATVYANHNTTNYGNATTIKAAYQGIYEVSSLIQFDLTSIPSGSTILDAKLSLYSKSGLSHGGNNSGKIQRVTSSWDESTVTWSTLPTVTSTHMISIPKSTSSNQSYTDIKVTDLVKDILANTNYGFNIYLDSVGMDSLIFGSSDHPDATIHPKLEIWYAPSSCTALTSDTVYATVTLNAVPPSDISASTVAIAQAKWKQGMMAEDFVTGLVNSVNSNYGSNNKGFIAYNAKGSGYIGEVTNILHVIAQPGSGKSYNRWKLVPSISYTSGLDSTCFKMNNLAILSDGSLGTASPDPAIFTGGFDEGQCGEDIYYADKVIVDTVNQCASVESYVENNGYSAGSVVMNGGKKYQCVSGTNSAYCNGASWAYEPGVGVSWTDAWIDLGDCSYTQLTELDGLKKTNPAFLESYQIDGLGTATTTSSSDQQTFLDTYQRMHWTTLNNVTSMQTIPVSGSSNLTIPAILESGYLDTTALKSYKLIRIRYKAPSCKDQCTAQAFPKDCNTNCSDQLNALDADIYEAYDTIAHYTFGSYTAPDNQNFVDLGNTVRTLKYMIDTYYPWSDDLLNKVDSVNTDGYDLYMEYYKAIEAKKSFNIDDCVRGCNQDHTANDACETCNAGYVGCIYEKQTELTSGYDYFMNLWGQKAGFPYDSLSKLQTEVLDPNTNTSYSPPVYQPTSEIDSLGALLYNYIVANFQTDTVYANWIAYGDTCRTCNPIGNTTYGCNPPANNIDLSSYPKKLIGILRTTSIDCINDYNDCFMQSNDTDLYICQQNLNSCLVGSNNSTDSSNCYVKYNCSVSTVGADSIQRRSMIDETLGKLYINQDTIAAYSDTLYSQTITKNLGDLQVYLNQYELQQKCILECENYLDQDFNQWLQNKIDSATTAITNSFINICYARNEKMEVNYSQSLYHYTLYEYNSAGQLISTVPPDGIDYVNIEDSDPAKADRAPVHRMKTIYNSNSIGELNVSFTPDGDTTQYLYDKAGRVRFSQTKEQKVRSTAGGKLVFSYTKYDLETGRITEVGEYSATTDANGYGFINPSTGGGNIYASDEVNDFSWPSDTNRTFEESYFFYDKSYLTLTGRSQDNLKNRVAKVSNHHANTYYSYDAHGRVKLVVQELLDMERPEQRYKTIDYQYLPVTSQVKQVVFQKGIPAEEFRHQYSYDSDNRITKVEVSRDSITWKKASAYDYYLHGPLKSKGLGDSIQKLDYVYNLQGWLKAINHPLASLDPGQDALGNAYTKDVFGMVLNYYSGDYKRIGKGLDATATITAQSGTHIKDQGKDLFNGNISSWMSYTGFDQTGSSTVNPLMAQGFRYDKLNRLVGSVTETKVTSGFSGWTASGTSIPTIFQENMKYDANGNIDTLIRTCGNVTTVMDNMFYRYANTTTDFYGKTKKTTNKLGYIDDDTDVSGVEDITDQSSGNYVYDAKGRLIRDVANGIDTIKWTPYDKVQEVVRTSGSSKPHLYFTYDAMGRRVSKKVIRSTSDSTQNSVTYYTYDASGNLMGTYKKEFANSTVYKYTLTEQYIYGSSREGNYANANIVYSSDTTVVAKTSVTTLSKSSLRFELTDHLGNVRAVVTGVLTNTGNATIASLSDYYPFGSEMPGRQFTASGGDYRYGFNGKEKDDEWSGEGNAIDFGGRIYDSRVGRWMSVDHKISKFPYSSPYVFVLNSPNLLIEKDGDDFEVVIDHQAKTITIVANVYVSKEGEKRAKAAVKFINEKASDKYEYAVQDDNGDWHTYTIKFKLNDPKVVKDPVASANNDPKGNSFVLVGRDEEFPLPNNEKMEDGTLRKQDNAEGITVNSQFVYVPKDENNDNEITDPHELMHTLSFNFHSKIRKSLMYEDHTTSRGKDITQDIIVNIINGTFNDKRNGNTVNNFIFTERNATENTPSMKEDIGHVRPRFIPSDDH
jgi:RHS repeat-associated protein